jgi:hypothetical protein
VNVDALGPAACAAFLLAACSLAGVCQAMWLGSPAARRFSAPIDAGVSWRGRRLLGDHKTLRGFVVMVPATAVSFVTVALLLSREPGAHGLWPLTPLGYLALGAWAGLGFMAGELPNSFLKRRLDIAPGQPAGSGVARAIFFVIDRVDSIVGLGVAMAIAVPVPLLTWVYIAVVGPVLHGLFSVLVYQLGGKARAA